MSKSKCLIDAIEISNQNVQIHKDLNVEIPKLPKNTRILDPTSKQHSSTTAIVRGADTMLNVYLSIDQEEG